MNLYLIEDEEADFDSSSQLVVAAETEEEARQFCTAWCAEWNTWQRDRFRTVAKCKVIGTAAKGVERGIICEHTI